MQPISITSSLFSSNPVVSVSNIKTDSTDLLLGEVSIIKPSGWINPFLFEIFLNWLLRKSSWSKLSLLNVSNFNESINLLILTHLIEISFKLIIIQ